MSGISIPLWRVIELTHDAGDGMQIGMDKYPIFDENERIPLNRKIIQHYWMRDIGLETISLFTHFMRAKMNEIMPMYNQLYLSEQIKFDPLATYDLETVRGGTTQGNDQRDTSGSTTSGGTSKSRSVNSTTPQVPLSGRGDYAAGAADVNASNTGTGSSTGHDASTSTTSTSDTSRTKGFQGAASDLLTRYRATILNIDMLVIDELPELFSLLWEAAPERDMTWSFRR